MLHQRDGASLSNNALPSLFTIFGPQEMPYTHRVLLSLAATTNNCWQAGYTIRTAGEFFHAQFGIILESKGKTSTGCGDEIKIVSGQRLPRLRQTG